MKRISILFWLPLLLLAACGKDKDFAPVNETAPSFQTHSWTSQEAQFFSLENHSHTKASFRSGEKIAFHPLLIETYNEIAQRNEEHAFVDSIVTHVGHPLWSQSYLYHNRATDNNLLLIPLTVEGSQQITGVIVARKETLAEGGGFTIQGTARQELLHPPADSASSPRRCGLIRWTYQYEQWLFQTTDSQLQDQYCDCEETEGDPPSGQGGQNDCIWRIIQICSDESTQTSWIAGARNIPLHLDHDQDGIYNWDDQDWEEFSTRNNITQDDFERAVIDWWEDRFDEEYGSYQDFWDDWPDWEEEGSDWQEFWEDLQDIWDSFWDWIGSDPYNDDQRDDLYYNPDYGDPSDCPFANVTESSTKSQSRSIRCEWFYILDCGETGDDLWDQFRDAVFCKECPDYESYQDMFRDRLYTYWEREGLKIHFGDLSVLVSGDCNAFAPDFEGCVRELYEQERRRRVVAFIDNYRLDMDVDLLLQDGAECNLSEDFEACLSSAMVDGFLRSNPLINLSAEERAWLEANPDIIQGLNALDERFTEDAKEYVIQILALETGLTLDDFVEGANEFAGIHDPIDAPEVEEIENGIEILSLSVPSSAQPGPLIGQNTPRGNTEDLTHGFDGDAEGIITGYLSKSDAFLFFDMDFLFNLGTVSDPSMSAVADEFVDRFRNDGTGTDFFHPQLSAAVIEQNEMKNFIKDFAQQLNKALAISDGNVVGLTVDLRRRRPIFNSLHDQFHGFTILLNDTESTIIKLLDYQYDSNTGDWEGEFYFEIIDHFGLDKADALKYQWWHSGFAAWWILQHKRGYVPFRTVMRINARVKGNIR
ncbi:MAG: DUF3289 family protein [Bacteroidota bacterium]